MSSTNAGGSAAQWHFYDPTQTSKHQVRDTESGEGVDVDVHSGPETDWWSTAEGSTPESDAHRSSGPVAYRSVSVDSAKSWKLSGWVAQPGQERFQQTTLFVKLGERWLKSGVENEGGLQYVGAVSTNPYSDWCLTPKPDQHDRVWIEIHKDGADLFIHYSYDGKQRLLLREVKGFCAGQQDQQGQQEWWLGVMVCGPKSAATLGTVSQLTIAVD
ncbi:hypothetical protein BCV70DRAFT_197647 [Testicularia cyperi]|uniref:Uncharacterized protein n=1 Tax=Testicularia cyperi TaxID=1882483 RepID=A0A317XYR7_9BASI|nr:hypothetical protein BCV70DRAFT_197647 [Testicularia cyperi]